MDFIRLFYELANNGEASLGMFHGIAYESNAMVRILPKKPESPRRGLERLPMLDRGIDAEIAMLVRKLLESAMKSMLLDLKDVLDECVHVIATKLLETLLLNLNVELNQLSL